MPGEIEAANLPKKDLGIRVFLQHGPERRRYVRWRKSARGHLVQQGLEKMEVPSVDNGRVDLRSAQRPRARKAAKSAPDDHDTMRFVQKSLHW